MQIYQISEVGTVLYCEETINKAANATNKLVSKYKMKEACTLIGSILLQVSLLSHMICTLAVTFDPPTHHDTNVLTPYENEG